MRKMHKIEKDTCACTVAKHIRKKVNEKMIMFLNKAIERKDKEIKKVKEVIEKKEVNA